MWSSTELPDHPTPEALARWLAPFDCQRWLVAFSGGADSTALLHLLHRMEKPHPPLHAIHVDHGLQAASADWARHCRHVCAALHIPLTCIRVQVEPNGMGLEAAARQARYRAFEQAMTPGDGLLLAHHEDDLAETLLLNLFRGAGLHGLSSLVPARAFAQGMLLRPLLGMNKAVLQQWLRTQGIHWLEDPSNADNRYRRNWLRHQLLPQIRQHWPQASQQIAASARHLLESRQLIDTLAESRLNDLYLSEFPQALDCQALSSLEPALQRQCLRLWLKNRQGHYPSRAKLDEVLRALRDTRPHWRIPWQGLEIIHWHQTLHLMPPLQPPKPWQQTWDGSKPLTLPAGAGQLQLLGTRLPQGLRWQVSLRQGGERIQLAGRKHHHSLKKLLQAAQLPPWERKTLPLILDEKGQLLAAGDQWISQPLQDWLKAHDLALHWHRPWRHRTMRPADSESHHD